MSYANRKQMSSNRTGAIIIVALVHILLGYALVSGLAMNVAKKAVEDLKTFDVEEEPPPPEEEPPPPEETPNVPPPPQVAAPPPLVRTPVVASPVQATPNPPPFVPTPVATPAPPAPPAPPPPPVRRIEPVSATGDVRNLFAGEPYPDAAVEAEATGTAQARLEIGATGRVTGCTVVKSAGHRSLDTFTCSVLRRKGRFTPARDSSGNPISGTVTTPVIRFVLQ
jgi:protein TonB